MPLAQPARQSFRPSGDINAGDRVSLLYGDLRDTMSIQNRVQAAQPDYVFHLAAQSFPHTSFAAPLDTMDTNIQGTVRVLDALKQHLAGGDHPCLRLVRGVRPGAAGEAADRRGVHVPSGIALCHLEGRHRSRRPLLRRGLRHDGHDDAHVHPYRPAARRRLRRIDLRQADRDDRAQHTAAGGQGRQPQSLRTLADVRDAVRAYYMLVTVKPTPGAYYNIGGSHSCTVKDILDTLISFSPCKRHQGRSRSRAPAPDRRRSAGAEYDEVPRPHRLEARDSVRDDHARPARLLARARAAQRELPRAMTLNKSDRILVTGAAGLMGSALVEHLHGQGYANVIALTRADCDLLDASATFAAFERLRPDHVFHSAARVYGILGSLKNQGPLFYDNVMMNTNVVEASRRAGARKVTAMGTGAVYPFPSPGLPLERGHDLHGAPAPRPGRLRQRQARHAHHARSLSRELRPPMGLYRLGQSVRAARQVRHRDGERRSVADQEISRRQDERRRRHRLGRRLGPARLRLYQGCGADRARRDGRRSTGRSTWAAAKSTASATWSTRSPTSPAWAAGSNGTLRSRTGRPIAATTSRRP